MPLSDVLSFCKFNFGIFGRIASGDAILQSSVNFDKVHTVLLYGLESCPLTKSQLASLDFVVRFLMKLFKTSNIEIVGECCCEFEFQLPSVLLSRNTENFLCKIAQIDNHMLNLVKKT